MQGSLHTVLGTLLTTLFNYLLFLIVNYLSQVKPLMLTYEESSVYGNRSGFQELLLVTANDNKNIFHGSSAWRRGVITGVSMLQRQEMVKPPRPDSKYGGDARFTKVQEMKQDSE